MPSTPTAIDLFSGAGGFTTGLKWAGFDVLWAVDEKSHCEKTYTANHEGVDFTCEDIRTLDPCGGVVETGELDLIVGGPPCPTFSTAGRGQLLAGASGTKWSESSSKEFPALVGDSASEDANPVLSDDRHHLFEDFIRFVGELEPRGFVMENVPGMRTAETDTGERAVERITRRLRSEGYKVKYEVVDAADFGVPQHRERLFIFGNRVGRPNPSLVDRATHREPVNEQEMDIKMASRTDECQVTLENYGMEVEEAFRNFSGSGYRRAPWITVGDAILDLPPAIPGGDSVTEYTIPSVTEYQSWARDIPDGSGWEDVDLTSHCAREHNQRDLTLYKLLGEGVGWTLGDLAEEFHPYRSDVFVDQFKKENPREPASTVNAHISKDGHMSIHPREARSFTIREAARLQSFKDSYEFPVSQTDAFRQIGNAVPPLLGEALGRATRETLSL